MKNKKHIKFAVLLSTILVILAVLAACASGASDKSDSGNNCYTNNAQDNGNSSTAESSPAPAPAVTPTPAPVPTPAPLPPPTARLTIAPAPMPFTPPVALEDIPDYITIQGMQLSTALTELNLFRMPLSDYERQSLRYMVNLTSLNLNAVGMYCEYVSLSDISFLAGLTNLTELWMIGGTITDLTPLAGLVNLTTLALSLGNAYGVFPEWGDFPDVDLTPLLGLTGLTSFRLELAGIQLGDISALAYLPTLTTLTLTNTQVSDLSPLAGLTNLRSLRVWGTPISDLQPLAELPDLRDISMSVNRGIDWSPLYNFPQRVPSPVADAAPANPHPFADALAQFFVNLTVPSYLLWGGLPYSYHAVLVDVDGRGTPGLLSARWAYHGSRWARTIFEWGSFSIYPRFDQQLFFMYDNRLHKSDWRQWGVTPAGRLVAIEDIATCGQFYTTYILMDVYDGRLVGSKSLSVSGVHGGSDWGYYAANYHFTECTWGYHTFARDWDYRQYLTRAEFDGLMVRYGLYGTRRSWEWPDDTYRVLAMTAD